MSDGHQNATRRDDSWFVTLSDSELRSGAGPPVPWPLIQGTKPVKNFDDLLGDFWSESESADDFTATVRQWRREDGCA